MAGSGGPWGGGGGGNNGGGGRGPEDDKTRDNDREEDRRSGGKRPGDGPAIPEIDEIMRKGQEQLRVLMGGRGKGNGNNGGGGPRMPSTGPMFSRQGVILGALAVVAAWSFMSFYTVATEERSVELFLGESSGIGQPGLNFAPWPVMTYEKVLVTGERTTDIGNEQVSSGALMLTRDQNVVDIGFQVQWNISDPEKYLFNLADPESTIRAVAESAMRDIIARSELSPILNRDRGVIASDLRTAVQATLDTYNSGINVIRVNLQRAAPPEAVIDSFRDVQAARQERDRLQNEADAYANQVTAGARGEAARLMEEAEAYRAQAVNAAQGEAARFVSVYDEYVKSPDVTRRRLYLETMEKVLGGMNKVILDGVSGGEGGVGQGVVPFLPLNELGRPATPAGAAAGGTN